MNDVRPPTRFSLAYILLFVVATAFGLAGLRAVHDNNFFTKGGYQNAPRARMEVERVAVYSSPVLIAWTFLALFQVLWRPWPSLRSAVGQPGFVACIAAVAAMIDAALYFVARAIKDKGVPPNYSVSYFNATVTLTETAGMIVIGAWLALVLAGRGRPGLSWPDRFACLVGLCWLFIFVIHHLYFSVTQYFM